MTKININGYDIEYKLEEVEETIGVKRFGIFIPLGNPITCNMLNIKVSKDNYILIDIKDSDYVNTVTELLQVVDSCETTTKIMDACWNPSK